MSAVARTLSGMSLLASLITLGTSLPLRRLTARDSQDLSVYTVYGTFKKTGASTGYLVKAWAVDDIVTNSGARCTLTICANNVCGAEANLTSSWVSYSSSFDDASASSTIAASWTVRCYGAERSRVGLDDLDV